MHYTQKKTRNKIVGLTLHWSTRKRVAGATKKQIALLKAIHNEVGRKAVDYFSLENMDNLVLAQGNIKMINQQVNKKLTIEKARSLIWEAKLLYEQLQTLLEEAGQKRDTSFYYNWLEEE